MTFETPMDLRTVYREPSGNAVLKQLDYLDRHATRFISLSPFLIMATSDENGRSDASPKGDPPGFVKVLDRKRLAIPDRLGNNRLDSLTNLMANPHVGLIFMIPGFDETLRVNGRAAVSTESDILEALAHAGKPPRSAILVDVEEVYLHCAKALIRSKLWAEESRVDRKEMPTLGRIIADQVAGVDAGEADAYIDANYRNELY